MKGIVLKAWTTQEHIQYNQIKNSIRKMVARGCDRKDVYDHISSYMRDGVSTRVLIYAGITAGELLTTAKKLNENSVPLLC